jgi:ATP/maltotriose-dependent transcriptional regulator MalT
MMTGSAAASLAALDRTLASPEITARHRARLLVLAARTHLHLGEVEEADRVVGHALQEATEAADNWAIAWALHVLTIVVGVKGYPADTLPLFDHALAATESDPALSDLRLLLRINQVVAFANLDRYDEALAAASQVRQLASQVGTTMRRTQAHSALGQLLFETGRWDDALAEVTAMDEDLKEPGAACCDPASLPSSASIAARRPRRGSTWRRRPGRPSGSAIGSSARCPWPAASTANRTAPCRRRWPC